MIVRERPAALARAVEWHIAAGGDERRTYRVQAAWPEEPPSGEGLPVLYVLDGDSMFATAVEASRLQSRRREVTGVRPGIVVGLGYPGGIREAVERRRCDYTPPVDGIGGANLFLDFIERDVKPLLASRFALDDGSAAIFGHSFGGLFALYALFTRPMTFRSYVAASPSIWWQNRAVLGFERCRRPSDARLLVTVGALEAAEAAGEASPERRERLRQADMVRNAHALADRLSAGFVAFEGEDHGSVVPAAISRAVRFTLGE